MPVKRTSQQNTKGVSMSEKLLAGLQLMVFGMGMVYLFLIVMIFCMKLMSKVIAPIAAKQKAAEDAAKKAAAAAKPAAEKSVKKASAGKKSAAPVIPADPKAKPAKNTK